MQTTITLEKPAVARPARTIRVGIIGLGLRITHVMRTLCKLDRGVRLAAVADPAIEKTRTRIHAEQFPGHDTVYLTNDVDELLEHVDLLDAILLGTRCILHTPIAMKVAKTGLPLFLEKPVATNWQQLKDLARAFEGKDEKVVVSFPLRCTDHVRTASAIIRSGRLGIINQVQSLNNVPYGGVYYGQWYRDYSAAGGLWLAKATHDFDYINWLLNARPIAITAMHSRLAYGGSMPDGLTCSKCDRRDTCPESPVVLSARGDDGGTLMGLPLSPDSDHLCSFSKGILNQDAGAALVMYEGGVHASYAQNFLPRRAAGFRGATVIGYDASLTLDFRGAKVRVLEHHRPRVEELTVKTGPDHFGGDEVLLQNFIDVIRGHAESVATLQSGLVSAAMCLAARDAAANGATQTLPQFGPTSSGTRQMPIVEPPQ